MDLSVSIGNESDRMDNNQEQPATGSNSNSLESKTIQLQDETKFFLALVASWDFLNLTENELCSILSSNAIGVNSEIEVLYSAVRWLTHNWEKRNQFQVDVIKCVRFNLMPSWVLVILRKCAVSPEVLKVLKHPEIQQMITDGISYVTSQRFFAKNVVEFHKFIKDMKLTPSPQRTWIYDKIAEYNYSTVDQKMASVTYEHFNAYLWRIQILGGNHWRQLKLAKDVNDSISNSSS